MAAWPHLAVVRYMPQPVVAVAGLLTLLIRPSRVQRAGIIQRPRRAGARRARLTAVSAALAGRSKAAAVGAAAYRGAVPVERAVRVALAGVVVVAAVRSTAVPRVSAVPVARVSAG